MLVQYATEENTLVVSLSTNLMFNVSAGFTRGLLARVRKACSLHGSYQFKGHTGLGSEAFSSPRSVRRLKSQNTDARNSPPSF